LHFKQDAQYIYATSNALLDGSPVIVAQTFVCATQGGVTSAQCLPSHVVAGWDHGSSPALTRFYVPLLPKPQWGAKLYANIRSVIETARRRAIGALEAIRLTLAGMPLPNPA
jgi:hypothetical protein